MKLLKFLLLIFAINIFCGCTESQTYNPKHIGGVGTIEKFEFEGHTYLIRTSSGGYTGWGGICHDENCKCKTDSI